MTLSRRNLMIGAGVVVLAGAAGYWWANRPSVGPGPDGVDGTALHAPGTIGDKIIGADNAPITMIEYASVTCPACAAFHTETYPTLKSKYIETGKVRFIFREFPTQPAQVAVAGFMLARCSGDNYFAFVETLFEQQRVWSADPGNGLMRIARQAGFTEDSFTACLKDDRLAQGIQEIAERGNRNFEVNSTPTFFINGQKFVGVLTVEQLEKILESML